MVILNRYPSASREGSPFLAVLDTLKPKQLGPILEGFLVLKGSGRPGEGLPEDLFLVKSWGVCLKQWPVRVLGSWSKLAKVFPWPSGLCPDTVPFQSVVPLLGCS